MKYTILIIIFIVASGGCKTNLLSQQLTNSQLVTLLHTNRVNYCDSMNRSIERFLDSSRNVEKVSDESFLIKSEKIPGTFHLGMCRFYDPKYNKIESLLKVIKKSSMRSLNSSLIKNGQIFFLDGLDLETGIRHGIIWAKKLFISYEIENDKIKILRSNRRGLLRNISINEQYWFSLIEKWNIKEIHVRNETQTIMGGLDYLCSRVIFDEKSNPKIDTSSFYSFE